MRRAFVEPMGLAPRQTRRLDATAADPAAECARFDRAIADAGGLGLAVLGLGPNGHLGFNEPPCPADAPSRLVELSPGSVASNAAYWGSEDRVPRRALTMGMAPILAARRILLVVSGDHKHAILRRTVKGPVGPDVPASWLQRHPRATVVADRAAWEGIG
jgi:glucosamine-6-phosphate deaminase